MDEPGLPLPQARCLSKEQAAEYLGIGLTLLAELNIPCVKFGRRCVYDVVDLDAWLNEYKQRGRAGKEHLWPMKPESTKDRILDTCGSTPFYRAESAYAKALGLKVAKTPKPC